jgi:DnaJ like chaperone protein
MKKLFIYSGILFLIIYIMSPFDAHPLFLDDIIASAGLFYLLYRYSSGKKTRAYTGQSSGRSNEKKGRNRDNLSLEEAYRLLGVPPHAPWEDVKKAYRDRISRSHPDKVSHLDRELQEKAAEVSLRVNAAMEIIKKSRGSAKD